MQFILPTSNTRIPTKTDQKASRDRWDISHGLQLAGKPHNPTQYELYN